MKCVPPGAWRPRQDLREFRRRDVRREPDLPCQLSDEGRSKGGFQLIPADGEVLARADPRRHDVAKSLVLERLDHSLEAPALASPGQQTEDLAYQGRLLPAARLLHLSHDVIEEPQDPIPEIGLSIRFRTKLCFIIIYINCIVFRVQSTAKEGEREKTMARKPYRMGAVFAVVVAAALALTVGSALAAAAPVDINTASKEQLEALPGIGPKKAQAVIDGRPYQKTEDIMKVKGIKQGIYNKIKDKITVQ
jgi:competence ComEA-like helix-hairpin-helix protein